MSKNIVIDKAYKGNGFEQGVLYCFNYHLKGLCNQCRARVDCQKERSILSNMGKELKKLSNNEIKINMKSIEEYSLNDIERMISV